MSNTPKPLDFNVFRKSKPQSVPQAPVEEVSARQEANDISESPKATQRVPGSRGRNAWTSAQPMENLTVRVPSHIADQFRELCAKNRFKHGDQLEAFMELHERLADLSEKEMRTPAQMLEVLIRGSGHD